MTQAARGVAESWELKCERGGGDVLVLLKAQPLNQGGRGRRGGEGVCRLCHQPRQSGGEATTDATESPTESRLCKTTS